MWPEDEMCWHTLPARLYTMVALRVTETESCMSPIEPHTHYGGILCVLWYTLEAWKTYKRVEHIIILLLPLKARISENSPRRLLIWIIPQGSSIDCNNTTQMLWINSLSSFHPNPLQSNPAWTLVTESILQLSSIQIPNDLVQIAFD